MKFLGIDEVGMSALAGPVVVAGVIHNEKLTKIKDLKDSKLLKPEQRVKIAKEILDTDPEYCIVAVSNKLLDKHTLVDAMFRASKCIIEELNVKPEDTVIFIDGKNNPKKYYQKRDKELAKFFSKYIIHEQPKADNLYYSVMAASILAKVFRDSLMKMMSVIFPYYDWEHNVGYYGPKHIEGIKKYGLSPLHRTRIIMSRFKKILM